MNIITNTMQVCYTVDNIVFINETNQRNVDKREFILIENVAHITSRQIQCTN